MGLPRGITLFLELKTGNAEPRADQRAAAAAWTVLGHVWATIRSVDQFDTLVDRTLEI